MFIELIDIQGNREMVNLSQVKRIFALPKPKGISRLYFEDSMDRFNFVIKDGKLEDKPSALVSKGPKAYFGFKDYHVDYSTLRDVIQERNELLAKLV